MKKQILEKFNEYKTNIGYSWQDYSDLLDKQLMTKIEYHTSQITMSLLYNDFGAYLRVWQNDKLEYHGIRLN